MFAHIEENPLKSVLFHGGTWNGNTGEGPLPRMELGGSWKFYNEFYVAHGLTHLPIAKDPEIGIKAGETLVIPLVILHDAAKPLPLNLTLNLPVGWKLSNGGGKFLLPAESSTSIAVLIETPALSPDQLKAATPKELTIRAEAAGQPAGEVKLKVQLEGAALPE